MDPKQSCSNVLFQPVGERYRKPVTYTIQGECCICDSHAIGKHGYPVMKDGDKMVPVSHIIYREFKGETNLHIRHTCDNKLCINPDHLIVGTHADNMKDAAERNRMIKGEAHYRSKLTDDQVATIRYSKLSNRVLGNIYGIVHTQIGKIKRRETWRHL